MFVVETEREMKVGTWEYFYMDIVIVVGFWPHFLGDVETNEKSWRIWKILAGVIVQCDPDKIQSMHYQANFSVLLCLN